MREATPQCSRYSTKPCRRHSNSADDGSRDPRVLPSCGLYREGQGRGQRGDPLQLGDSLSLVRQRASLHMTDDLLKKSLDLADAFVHVCDHPFRFPGRLRLLRSLVRPQATTRFGNSLPRMISAQDIEQRCAPDKCDRRRFASAQSPSPGLGEKYLPNLPFSSR